MILNEENFIQPEQDKEEGIEHIVSMFFEKCDKMKEKTKKFELGLQEEDKEENQSLYPQMIMYYILL